MENKDNILALSATQNSSADMLDVLAESGVTLRDMKQGFRKAMMTATCISKLKGALTPEVMQPIMQLQGSSLGFRTDQDHKGGYPLDVVQEVLISAVMVGLMPCGNQFNVIAGRMYVTKEGFTYLLDQAGVKYTIDQAVPLMKNGGAIVATDLSWSFENKEGKKHLEIPVRVNNGMGADAILGKADRKAKCWLYNNLLHAQLSDGDAEGATMRDVTPERTPSPTQASPMKASPMRAATARVVDAEPIVEHQPADSAEASPVDETQAAPSAEDCSGAFNRLQKDLSDAGKDWVPFTKWLREKGFLLPKAGNLNEHNRFAAWIYEQEGLLTDMVDNGWIVRSLC